MTSFLSRLMPLLVLAACTPDDVVAKVGRREITRDDVALYQRSVSNQVAFGADKALESLVTRELLAEAATQRALAQTPEVRARLKAAEREILAQALIEAVTTTVDDVAAKDRYDSAKASFTFRQLRLAHIFFAAAADTPEVALSRANAAWGRLLGGDDFAAVAKEVSEDSATSATGGDLGLVREGQVGADIFAAAAELKAGAFSKPIVSGYGVHVLKAMTAVETVEPPFADVKGQVLALLRREREAEALETARTRIRVKRWPEHLASPAPRGAEK